MGSKVRGRVFGSLRQVCIVVDDIDATLEELAGTFGLGPWDGYHFCPKMVSGMRYRGRDEDFEALFAVTKVGKLEFELVQPIGDNNIFAEELSSHGKGIHHICFDVRNFDFTDSYLVSHGSPRVHEGTLAGGTFFAYYDCRQTMGCFLELRCPAPDPGGEMCRFDCPAPAHDSAVFSKLLHVSFVSPDVWTLSERLFEAFDLYPWSIERYESPFLTDTRYGGVPSPFGFDAASCDYGDGSVEVVAPAGGSNIYADTLAERGEGPQHICFEAPDFARASQAMEQAGCPVAQEGVMAGSLHFAYFDCRRLLGCYVELFEML
jgi:catechol 2,3-dioxygenase-like lactoylglutathione lyase family enzyme